MEKIGIGVIGCGGMGSSLANSAKTLEHVEVLRVSDVDESRAKNLANQLSVEYDLAYHELFKHDEIQAVLVATPPFMHSQVTVDAASAKKHVFCEKPMAPTLEACDAMIKAAQENGVKLTIGLVCRYHATHSKVRELVHSGELGKPVCMMVSRIGGRWGGGHPSWRFKRELSGGSLMEINAHEIDFMRFVFGDVKSVYAVGGTYVQFEADYPDVMVVSLNFKNGAVGTLHSSHVSAIGAYGGRVDCENGSIYFPGIWGGGATITYQKVGESAQTIPISEIKVEEPVKHEIRRFVDAIIKNEEPLITGYDGRAAVEIALAAYQSVETGEKVDLPIA